MNQHYTHFHHRGCTIGSPRRQHLFATYTFGYATTNTTRLIMSWPNRHISLSYSHGLPVTALDAVYRMLCLHVLSSLGLAWTHTDRHMMPDLEGKSAFLVLSLFLSYTQDTFTNSVSSCSRLPWTFGLWCTAMARFEESSGTDVNPLTTASPFCQSDHEVSPNTSQCYTMSKNGDVAMKIS